MPLFFEEPLDKIGLFQEKITLPPRRRMAGWKSLEGGLWPWKSVREGGVGVPGNPGRCAGGVKSSCHPLGGGGVWIFF